MVRLLACVAFGILSIALLANSGFSQDGKKEGKTKGMLPPGFKDLNLSKDQVSKIYGVQNEFKNKKKSLEDEMTKLKTQERTEIMKVLTDDQKQLLLKLTVGEGGKKGDTPPAADKK